MQKKEQKFTIKFRSWIKANPMASGAYELKSTRGKNSFSFRELHEHQVDALMAAKTVGIFYKISDESIGYKPFDCLYLRNAYAWVVIEYPQGFVLIDIEVFINENKRSKVRSLSWGRARELATIEVKY